MIYNRQRPFREFFGRVSTDRQIYPVALDGSRLFKLRCYCGQWNSESNCYCPRCGRPAMKEYTPS